LKTQMGILDDSEYEDPLMKVNTGFNQK